MIVMSKQNNRKVHHESNSSMEFSSTDSNDIWPESSPTPLISSLPRRSPRILSMTSPILTNSSPMLSSFQLGDVHYYDKNFAMTPNLLHNQLLPKRSPKLVNHHLIPSACFSPSEVLKTPSNDFLFSSSALLRVEDEPFTLTEPASSNIPVYRQSLVEPANSLGLGLAKIHEEKDEKEKEHNLVRHPQYYEPDDIKKPIKKKKEPFLKVKREIASIDRNKPRSRNTHDKSGSSCHQCKSRRQLNFLIYCCNSLLKNKDKRGCRKKYCEQCLRKFYEEKPPPRHSDSTVPGWLCPACRACRRIKEREEGFDRIPSPPIIHTNKKKRKFLKSKQIKSKKPTNENSLSSGGKVGQFDYTILSGLQRSGRYTR